MGYEGERWGLGVTCDKLPPNCWKYDRGNYLVLVKPSVLRVLQEPCDEISRLEK